MPPVEDIRTPPEPAAAPPPEPAAWEPASRFYRRLIMTAMGLLVLVLTIHLLQLFATVLQQLFIAAFIVCAILPAHRWLVRHGLWPSVAAVLIVLIFLGCSFGIGQMTYYSLNDLYGKLPTYKEDLRQLAKDAARDLLGKDIDPLGGLFDADKKAAATANLLWSAVGNFLGFLSQTFVVLIYLGFLLAERGGLVRRVHAAYGIERSPAILAVVDRISTSIEEYIAVLSWISLLAGVIVTGVLWLFGVPYAVFWGVLTFALNFIPYLGSIIATVLPVLLTLVAFKSVGMTLAVLAVLLVIQNGIGYFIQPRIAGNRLDLSPLVIILSLAFWGTLWGIAGMILAVPLVVVIRTVLANIPQTRPIATLLSNQ
jgi:predicted PurR-regulated permease PerM